MKAVIFDFDGVIHDTFDLAYKINTEVLGYKLSKEKYRDFFNGNIYDRPEINEEGAKTFFEKQNEAFEYLRIEESMKIFLKSLSEKYLLFIITSNQEKTLDTYFRNNNFLNIFTQIMGMETNYSKVEKFKIFFEKYKLKKEECVFVTDTLGDILEANKVGVKTIAVDFGFHERERLKKGNPYKIVSSLDEIEKIID